MKHQIWIEVTNGNTGTEEGTTVFVSDADIAGGRMATMLDTAVKQLVRNTEHPDRLKRHKRPGRALAKFEQLQAART